MSSNPALEVGSSEYCTQLADLTIRMGHTLLTNGAEIYRVEECMKRILQTYYPQGGEVFTIPSCIIVSVSLADMHSVTRILRVYTSNMNLDRIRMLNELSRNICNEKPSFYEIDMELSRISEAKVYSTPLQIFACAMVAASFTIFFGGTLADGFAALFCGTAIKLSMIFMKKLNINYFFIHVICSFISTIIAYLAVHFTIATNTDIIIIGAFMNLVPGIAITNFMRDIITGDLIAGLTKLSEALLYSTAIATGVAAAIFIANYINIL